jgi:glyceraldehyde 3-phosphate dehydrogenase
MVTIALNGFGRIGRNFLRTIFSDKKAVQSIAVVALNIGPADPNYVAHSFKYDTLMGTFDGTVSYADGILTINGHTIQIYTETDPAKLDWKQHAVDWVVDVTGKFTKKSDAQKHIQAGAKRVLISAPSQDADVTIILGVNSDDYTGQKIVSLGSCTTNAATPLLHSLHTAFGLESVSLLTVHAYTNDQSLLDVEHKDIRRARAAALNIIPTSTGASKVVEKILPDLAGKIVGSALRVPVGAVSLIDVTFTSSKQHTVQAINDILTKSAQSTPLKGIMKTTEQELVSSDFRLNNHSVVIDLPLTQSVGSLARVFGWYDNEWGYSCRLKEFILKQI